MVVISGEENRSEAFVTMVLNDSYVVGALVLGHSLREQGTTRRLICMVTANLATDSIDSLREVFEVRYVSTLDSADEYNLRLLGRPELGPTFTKIQLWTFEDLSKVVFLDADMLILQNIDDLFGREEFSACADVGWPDCFNSGLFVARPSMVTYAALLEMSRQQGSFDGGDQGLLNAFFNTWAHGPSERRIPFIYNLTFNACYSYLPAFERNKSQVKAVHFIGANKPWHFNRFSDGQVAARGDGAAVHLEYVQRWWNIHDKYVKPKGFNPYSTPAAPTGQSMMGGPAHEDFANYRIKWTSDVEGFFQKKVNKLNAAARKMPKSGTPSDDEHDILFGDGEDRRIPIKKPAPR